MGYQKTSGRVEFWASERPAPQRELREGALAEDQAMKRMGRWFAGQRAYAIGYS